MDSIKNKINTFIRKLYLYKAYENLLILILYLGIYFLLYIIIEYIFYLSTTSRTILFFSSISISLIWATYYIFFPILQSFIPKFQISKEKASVIIGNSNNKIEDKLLNLLQLEKINNNDLTKEGIKQLEENLSNFNFSKGISIKKILIFGKLSIILLLIFSILSIVNFENIIANPTKRIISYNTIFNKPLDFDINIINKKLEVIEDENFVLKFKSNSKENIFIFIENDIFEIFNENDIYTYIFNNNKEDIHFKIGESIEKTYKYKLDVITKPKIKSILLECTPPKYTNIPKYKETNLSKNNIIEGSKVKWIIDISNGNNINFSTKNFTEKFNRIDNLFQYNTTIDSTFNYSINISNHKLKDIINLNYKIEVIPDEYPKINIKPIKDIKYDYGTYKFEYSANDDYGITKIGYNISYKNKVIFTKTEDVTEKSINNYFSINTNDFKINDKLSVIFFVIDNDEINGNKKTFSSYYHINSFSKEEVNNKFSILKDSLINTYSKQLNNNISEEKFNTKDIKQNSFSKNKEELKILKQQIKKSIEDKKLLLKNIKNINDKKLENEIKKAISHQEELLKKIEEALKNPIIENKKLDKFSKQNNFQEAKTLNFLKKIALKELLRKLSKEANTLDKLINDNKKSNKEISKQVKKIKNKLKQFSDIKENNSLEKELNKELENILKEYKKGDEADKKSIEKSNQKIKSKLKKEESSSNSKQEQLDKDEVKYLFSQYIILSFLEEDIIQNFDINSNSDHIKQYDLLKTLIFLNKRLYDLSITSEEFSRASFDFIYSLYNYKEKIGEAYENQNNFILNQRQRELLSDINSITDLLSDVKENMDNNPKSGESSDGEKNTPKGNTPKDLIEEQKKLNSKTNNKQGEKFSKEEILKLIQKQEEIRNKFNALNKNNKEKIKKFNKAVDKLKRELLKNNNKNSINRQQRYLKRLLKDFNGESREENEKRKSNPNNNIIKKYNNKNIYIDSIFILDDKLKRKQLDYNKYYKNKILNK